MDEALLNRFVSCVEDVWSADKWLGGVASGRSLEAYEDEIKGIQRILNRVDSALHVALARVQQGRNTWCRVNQLPVEVLRHIFQLAGDFGSVPSANMAIASTCTYWRTVALNNALMWTCLDEGSGRSYWSLALKLSQPMLLSMHFPRSRRSDISRTTLSLRDNLHRLRALSVDYVDEAFLFPAHAHVPLLERLTLSYCDGEQVLPPYNTPSLRHLSLTHCYIPRLYDTSKCLTNISIDLWTPDDTIDIYLDIRAIFQNLANLEYVSLQLPYEVAPPPAGHTSSLHTERFLMKRLRHLTLGTSAILIHDVLRSIAMPSLEMLRVEAFTAKANDDPSVIRALFSTECLPTSLLCDLVTLSAKHTPHHMSIDDAFPPAHTESDYSDPPTRRRLSITAQISPGNKAVHALFDDILIGFSQLMPKLHNFAFFLNFDDRTKLYNGGTQPIGGASEGVASIISSHRDISSLRIEVTGFYDEAFLFIPELMEFISNVSAPGPLPSLRYCFMQLRVVPGEATANFLDVMQFLLSSPKLNRLELVETIFPMRVDAVEGFAQDLRNLGMDRVHISDCHIIYKADVGDGSLTTNWRSL